LDPAFDLGANILETICSRYYVPDIPIFAPLAAASPDISILPSPFAVGADLGLAAGDVLPVFTYPWKGFASSGQQVISGIVTDTGAGTATISMGGAAGIDVPWAELDWWIRQAPPNESAR
ncbi:MAG: hypothetical protein AAFQ17_00070, partial [Pseudomonadota bacterium]